VTRAVGENLPVSSSLFTESVEQRFVHDGRGRLVPGSGAGSATVPRVYLGRSPDLILWRFSATLESDRVIQLARLAALERPLPRNISRRIEMPPPPERLVALSERLGRGDPAPLRFRGPLLTFDAITVEDPPGKARVREFTPVGESLGEKQRDDSGRPGVALEVEGHVVATCRSRRHWPGWGAECVVETADAERGRGYGQAVLRAWCEAIRRRGEIPLARPQWSDRGALALARLLGANCIGEGFEFE